MSKKIKILFLLPKPGISGGMAAITKMYYEVNTFDNKNIQHFDTSFYWDNKFLRVIEFFILKIKYISKIISFKPDVISVITSSYWGFFDKIVYCAIAKAFSIKSMLNPVGGGFSDFYFSNKLNRKLVDISLKVPNCLLLGSNYWIDFFSKHFPGKKIYNLPNPVNTSQFYNSNSKTDNYLRIVSISSIIEEKGILELTQVIKLVCHTNKKVCFVLMGGGNLLNYLRENLIIESERKQVEILGIVSDAVKIEELSKADLFILLSHFELIPISILEAMSSSLPIISTDVGGIPDLIEDNVNGYLFKKKEVDSIVSKIEELCINKTNLEKMGQKSKEKVVSNFDIKTIIEKQIQITNDLIN